MTWIFVGAIPIKNLKIIGQTTKNAKHTPLKNKIIVESINGAVTFFSSLYKPGKVNVCVACRPLDPDLAYEKTRQYVFSFDNTTE